LEAKDDVNKTEKAAYEYRMLTKAEAEYCDNRVRSLPFCAVVTDANTVILYKDQIAERRYDFMRIRSYAKIEGLSAESAGSVFVTKAYGKASLVSVVSFTPENRELLLVAILPEMITADELPPEVVTSAHSGIIRALSDMMSASDKNVYSKAVLTRLAKTVMKNRERERDMCRIMYRFRDESYKMNSRDVYEYPLSRLASDLVSCAGRQLYRMGVKLNVESEPDIFSEINPYDIMYAVLSVVNFCVTYTADDEINVSFLRSGGRNVIRFVINDRFNAIEVFNGFFISFPPEVIYRDMSNAFVPFALANSICASYGVPLSYINTGGKLYVTMSFKRIDAPRGDLPLRASDAQHILLSASFEEFVFGISDITAAVDELASAKQFTEIRKEFGGEDPYLSPMGVVSYRDAIPDSAGEGFAFIAGQTEDDDERFCVNGRLTLPERIRVPEYASKALGILEKNGYEAYIVGGFVRNSLLGGSTGDVDVAASSTPEETKSAFEGYPVIETGAKHGTVTVIIDGCPVEITTFRADGGYRDRRHPDSVAFIGSLREDLKRRDFTVNALCCDRKGVLIDLLGGIDDLENGVIRAIGDPRRRFSEDALRILRAVRFSSVLGFGVAPETKAAMFALSNGLKSVSAERKYAEISKTLCGKNASRAIAEFYGIIIDGVLLSGTEDQPDLSANLSALTALPEALHLRFAALFCTPGVIEREDAQKETVKALTVEEKAKLYGKKTYGVSDDARKSAAVAEKCLKALRADGETVRKTRVLLMLQDAFIGESDADIKLFLRFYGPDTLYDLIRLKSSLPESRWHPGRYDAASSSVDRITASREPYSPADLAIDGNDLIGMGAVPGRRVGEVLEKLLCGVISGRLENKKETLVSEAAMLLEENISG